MKIVFAGTPEFAAKSLSHLIAEGFEIIAVYTQPDRPAGRGKKLMASEVKQVAESHSIPVYQPVNFKDPQSIEALSALKADLMIVAAYGIILPKIVLETPRLGCINIHASLLPRWRGAAPIQRAIEAGDDTTGITIMQMDEGLDTGNMLLKKTLPILDNDTGGSLHDKLADLGAASIVEYLKHLSDYGEGESQDNQHANYAKKLSKNEAKLDFSLTASELLRKIRAFNPWPVSFLETQDQRVRIFEAEQLKQNGQHPVGTVISKSIEGIDIACAENVLRITRLQLPGGKAISAKEFVNGGKAFLEPGDSLQ